MERVYDHRRKWFATFIYNALRLRCRKQNLV